MVEDLKVLASAKIFFGHQSVGNDILDGLKELSEKNNVDLLISDYKSYDNENNGIIIHANVGKNKDPKSKCEDFVHIIEQGLSEKVDFAILKFCYIDIRKDTDVLKVFTQYQETIDDLISRYDHISFIHTTVPLESLPKGPKVLIKKLIGKEIAEKENNLARCYFNTMLTNRYGEDCLFDLARSESVFSDGRRNSREQDGTLFYSLINDYTDDGGHLNTVGKLHVASEFVRKMAEIIRKRGGS